jgi:signal transduction histidine kinase
MMGALGRLRWQLTLSHLVATAFTLLCMIAAAVFFATLMAGLRDNPRREPAQDAQAVARAVEGLAAQGNPALLNAVLAALVDGRLRLSGGGWPFGPEAARRPDWMGAGPRTLAYAVLVGPDGQVIASSDPAGATFAPLERDLWTTLAAQAQRGVRSPEDLVVLRPGERPAVLAAYPVVDEGARFGAVVVAESALPPTAGPLGFVRALFIFGAASVAVLAAASVFALVSASVLAYFLARRLVLRLERLGQAAAALAAGDLGCRVPEGPADEVGQLARRFNAMAADLERSLRDLQAERDRVAGLLDAQRQLVAGVSHELRTPVATLRGYVETALRREPAGPSVLRADLETMEQEIERLQRLIEDLFTLSRAAVGRLALRVAPTDAGAVVRRLVETTAPLAWGQRRVQVLAEVPPGLPAAQADPQRLEQIVSNLLGNAVRHTPPGGLVAAAVAAEPDAVRVEVRDTGEGIAPEDLPHVFERFYRGRNGSERGGAGLGLALTKELAEAMGGSVEAASTPGAGSCFTVRLPRSEPGE